MMSSGIRRKTWLILIAAAAVVLFSVGLMMFVALASERADVK